MTAPFEFVACVELKEMLGRAAWDERQLLNGIEQVSEDSIFYHLHSSFLRSRYLRVAYPSDFATWAAAQLQDPVLAERLAAIDPFAFDDLESVRAAMLDVLDDHLQARESMPRVGYGEPFHFMQSTIVEIPTGIRPRTLEEFADALVHVDDSVIYYHLFRPVRNSGRVDLVQWLEHDIGRPAVAARVRRLRPYVRGLEGLRADLVATIREAVSGGAH